MENIRLANIRTGGCSSIFFLPIGVFSGIVEAVSRHLFSL